MIHYQDYVAAWLDSSIHEFLEILPRSSASMKYALITCLDSHLNPSALIGNSPELTSLAPAARALGTGLLLPTRDLIEADSRSQLFFGFDEVWFFPSDSVEPKPDSACLVGPARIDQAKLDKLGKWMSANECSLALGDGEALNLIVKARGLVKHVVGHSIDQPQASATFVAAHAEGLAG